MKISIFITAFLFLLSGYTNSTIDFGDNIRVSTKEGENSLVFKCSYPAKYYSEIFDDIQEYDSDFTPMSKTYTLGNGSAVIKFKSKGKLEIRYKASDNDFMNEKEKLQQLSLQISQTLGQSN